MTENRQRGEVGFSVAGKPYVLRLSINAIVAMEKRVGATFGQITARIEAQSVASMTALLWAGLQAHHGAEFPTVEAAADLADQLGPTLMEAMEQQAKLLTELVAANQPPAELQQKPAGAGAPGGGPENPPPAGGTGSGSSPTPAA